MFKLLVLFFSFNVYSQGSTNIINSINVPNSVNNPTILIGANPVPSGLWKVYIKDDIRWETYNINNFSSQVISTTSLIYKPINYAPTASEINSALGYAPLQNESDPVWISVSNFYKTKIENDLLYVPLIRTVNSKALSNNITLDKIDIGLSNVDNTSDANKPISNMVQAALNTKISTEVDGSITNEIQTLSLSGNTLSLSSGGGSVNILPSIVNSNVVRSLNTNYTISTTKTARVTYTVRISYNVTVLLGSLGTVELQYSTNSGVNWITVSTISNSLNLGLALTGYNDFTISGDIPANALVRLNSNTTNATNSYRTGQEVY